MGGEVTDAKEEGSAVNMQLRTRTGQVGKVVDLVRGGEIVAMIVKNFRTTSHVETCSTLTVSFNYPGDRNSVRFFRAWDEILSNTKPSDVPNDDTLRDCLFRKSKNSIFMAFDIRAFETMIKGDPEKCYNYLIKMMKKFIEKQLE